MILSGQAINDLLEAIGKAKDRAKESRRIPRITDNEATNFLRVWHAAGAPNDRMQLKYEPASLDHDTEGKFLLSRDNMTPRQRYYAEVAEAGP